ncbi:hypothetical protein BX616_003417 [Lobosporangium transversale]|uniref:C2H2 type zinc-finger-domain-containing protein n=1 Tax=Lobosporangium transversale TaxID=64571 RepID=A0A1Y2GV15_9FUNG|nr:C2H2 type zinc-finger-domain-containing protein [Lobosporangium transversale]KAF9916570.1 hypothetical protein BX616_003417 [Lobosporangium transversale]ORZ24940.1 C2H2 type zinc-finger-domain-containing protein [Lobosporangium transversale]|eukprot:XP_021883921.1 C2H2 type zinc-finger-domain-containing protein [Lobosporangium transversale]
MSYAVDIPAATIGQSTTCLTCAIRLPSLETQQLHHKSDWHTYNLKRKMVYLPPVSSEVFTQLVHASREQANPKEGPQPECIPCGKKYLSLQAYDNHVNSKKHKQTVLSYEKKQQKVESTTTNKALEDSEAVSAPINNANTISTPTERQPNETVCLFCSNEAEDATANYAHMRSTHGFFLPSSERLVDLAGMLTYLAEKLLENYDCLWCTPSIFTQNLRPDQELHGGFSSLASVRRHMIDKGHCKLSMEKGAEREYADFYLPVDYDENVNDSTPRESLENSSMDMDDEDQRRLNMVLLDEDGNWILDKQDDNNSGIYVDPLTNELVLNNRRLARKDAARRQKVESRTVTLAPRAHRRPSESTDATTASTTTTEAEGEANEDSTLANDPHNPGLKVSDALLKSQNQLSDSTLAVSHVQLEQVATMIASAQDYESEKRSRMATKLSTSNNLTGRRRCGAPFGTKV